jgi:hypothetical protein
MPRPYNTPGESLRNLQRRPPNLLTEKAQVESSGITEKDQPTGDAAFGSQHVTANQRKDKRKRERDKPACRVEASSVKQHTARTRRSRQQTKPELKVSRDLGTSICFRLCWRALCSVDHQQGSSLNPCLNSSRAPQTLGC